MKTALRSVCLSLALAAGVPALALAGPTKPAPAKAPAKAPATPAPAAKPPPADDNTGLIVGAVIGGVLLLGGGVFIATRLLSSSGGGKGDGRPPEPLVAERKHDWELRLTAEQEAAMLRGIQAWRDAGHSLYLGHSDAILSVYEPAMLVSLHRLTDAFLAAGPQGMADPVGVMRGILDGFTAAESPGVLHLPMSWYTAPIDGLDNLKFMNLCYETLTNPQPYIEGSQGSYGDENKGCVTVNVQVDGPMNTICMDLGRVLGRVQEARQGNAAMPLIELVRPVLQAMARGQIPGATWTRGAGSPAEVDLVCRMVAAGAPRAS
jgi:hypothetical protein